MNSIDFNISIIVFSIIWINGFQQRLYAKHDIIFIMCSLLNHISSEKYCVHQTDQIVPLQVEFFPQSPEV